MSAFDSPTSSLRLNDHVFSHSPISHIFFFGRLCVMDDTPSRLLPLYGMFFVVLVPSMVFDYVTIPLAYHLHTSTGGLFHTSTLL